MSISRSAFRASHFVDRFSHASRRIGLQDRARRRLTLHALDHGFQKVTLESRRAFGGLLDQKARWSLSPRGWLVLMSLLLGAGATLFFQVQPFLAVTHRVPTDVLVVEGWIPRYAIDAAVYEFKNGSYLRAYTTGGPVNDSALYDHETAAQLGAARLIAAGTLEGSDPSSILPYQR